MDRSFLFVPAHRETLIIKAIASAADTLIFDFEDSVPDGTIKDDARRIYQEYKDAANQRHAVWVRVNDPSSGQYADDLQALRIAQPDAILHPKVESRDDFEIRMAQQYSEGVTSRGAALIESPSGVANIADICRSRFIHAVVYGNEDYEAELFCLRPQRTSEMLVARGSIALHAKANRILAIDTVTVDFKDETLLEERIDTAVRLGFDGKLCLSPKEIAPVNRAFSASAEQIADARKILELNHAAKLIGHGVSIEDKTFVGPPMVKKAKRLVSEAGGEGK